MEAVNNLHVREIVPLPAPRILKAESPVTDAATATVVEGRETVKRILSGADHRLLLVIGPCSIHDPAGAMDYARRLAQLRAEIADQIYVVMRVYFEKPRTTIGWKGLINDPHMDGTADIQSGLRLARRVLLDITSLGVPAATEFLDPVVPQYIAELVSWAAIGARTTESQTHREMASGLSMPVGFKNATDGSLQIAMDAMYSARTPHSFLGIDQEGATSIIRTTGNRYGHVVLRGGRARTNYDAASIADAVAQLRKASLPAGLMVDCSHANSLKQHAKQEEVWQSLIAQRAEGNTDLIGAMIESNLHEGSQPVGDNPSALKYGVSVTDACVGWETTERLLRWGRDQLAKSAAARSTHAALAAR